LTEEVKQEKKKKELPIAQVTTCKSTQQMLRKAAEDGVETAMHRAMDMKACPIGADCGLCLLQALRHGPLSALQQGSVW
jgi:carbon-monoxide dehydrogenase catalytic subunit